jgi:hypothetical protein
MKTVDSLTAQDLRDHPVWQYVAEEGSDETTVRPVKRIPVGNLTGKVVGVQILLANGDRAWGLLGSVDPSNARLTQHFLTLSVERNGRWFHLARYHDFDRDERGPEQLADFLGLPVTDVFPISYDISACAKGDPSALAGTIPKEPAERLSRAEIIGLAVP